MANFKNDELIKKARGVELKLHITNKSPIYILLVITLLTNVMAISPISPEDSSTTTETQPLFSWTDYSGAELDHYLLEISSDAGFATTLGAQEITNNYYQLQTELEHQTWYWRIQALDATDTVLEITPAYSFTISEPPTYDLSVDASNYQDDQSVEILLNAPLGSQVDITITRPGFTLPFTTDNLQTTSFTSFLEPGTYSVAATFVANGLSNTYTTSFTLEELAPEEYTTIFNVTNNDTPIKDVLVTLEYDDDIHEKETNKEGLATFTLASHKYDITITKEGYIEESFTKTLNKNQTFNITLELEETEEEIIRPQITITSPNRGDTFTDDITVEYTITEHNIIRECQILYRKANQQGWASALTIFDDIGYKNNVELSNLPIGNLILKVICETEQDITEESAPRSITREEKEQKNKLINSFLDILSSTDKTTTKIEGLTTLNIPASYSAARKELIDLQATYDDAPENQKNALEKEIKDKIQEYNETLIKTITTISSEDKVTFTNEAQLDTMIDWYVKNQNLTEKQKEKLTEIIRTQQDLYTTRTLVVVAELKTLDDSVRYVTSITRTILRYESDPKPESITLYDYLPSEILQRIGRPEITIQGGGTGTIIEDYVQLPLQPGGTYNYLFEGNVQTTFLEQNAQVIIEPYDKEKIFEEKSLMQSITGAVVELIPGEGNAQLVMYGVIIALVLIVIFRNPVYNVDDWRLNKKIKNLTEHVHITLNHIENNNYEQAFTNYPKILNLFEKLPSTDQNELFPVMQHLAGAVNQYGLTQQLHQAMNAINTIRTQEDYQALNELTQKILLEYRQLDQSSQEQIYPLLAQYKQMLRQRSGNR